ncbi:MAG: trimethylamine methyltransferase family protein [Lachnospiraceae bacterium]|nr:trimethylamine methyltransferase family protein [Lachnospiraceae bacterium]
MQRYQMVTQNEIEKIHENSLKIMEQIGVVMTDQISVEILKKHGCQIDGKIVKFPKELVEKAIRLSPSSYMLYGRNPDKNVEISCKKTAYAGPYGSPFVLDLDRGRRRGKRQDFIELVKIIDQLKNIDIQSHITCEPMDVSVNDRPTTMVFDTIKYSEKPLMGSIFGYENSMRCIKLAAIPFGGLEAIKEKPVIASIPCTLTPLSYDSRQLEAIRAYAETGQPQLINSLSIAGMTTPVTVAGLVSVQNAEVLAGIVLAQCVNPGTPVIYSASGSSAEMRNGLLTIGSPEDAVVSLLNGQLCKYYQIPCRISGALSDSKCVDAQAGYESAITLLMAQMAGGNFILHAAGILETYTTTSYEKLIMDNEIIGYAKRINQGVEVNEDTLAYDVISDVGPQGTYIAEDHTIEYMRQEVYNPTLSNHDPYEIWVKKGSLTAEQEANKKWKGLLESYGESTLSADVEREMRHFIENEGFSV